MSTTPPAEPAETNHAPSPICSQETCGQDPLPTEAGDVEVARLGEVVHDRGAEPDSGWFIVGEGGYFDADNAVWCEPEDGDAPWTSDRFDMFGTVGALAARETETGLRANETAAIITPQTVEAGTHCKFCRNTYAQCTEDVLRDVHDPKANNGCCDECDDSSGHETRSLPLVAALVTRRLRAALDQGHTDQTPTEES